MKESYWAADEVIELLNKTGKGDYTKYREQIADELIENGLYSGNWDTSIDFDDMPGLRAINEDEYEQHMDDNDSKPVWDDMVGSIRGPGAYLEHRERAQEREDAGNRRDGPHQLPRHGGDRRSPLWWVQERQEHTHVGGEELADS